MSKTNYLFALDVGSSVIKSVVGEIIPNLPLQIIAANTSPASGVRKGQVIEIEDASAAIKENLKETEKKIGERYNELICSVSGSHIESITSRGIVAISRADGEVSEKDVERVIKAAEAITLPKNKEILHTIPKEFIVDKEGGIKNPVGAHGIRLEVETEIILGFSPYINNLIKAVEQAGYLVKDLVFSSFAGSLAVLSKRQKELGVLVLDLGAEVTGLCIFEEGTLLKSTILPIGASHITNDIAIAFQLPLDTAEKLKLKYGFASEENISKKEEIKLEEIDIEEKKVISRRKLIEVIEARNIEILEMVNKELKKVDRERLLPAGVVLIGGGAKMPGLEELVKRELHLPCQIGYPREIEGIIDKIDDPSFATVIGLLFWQLNEELKKGGISKGIPVTRYLSKLKKWIEGLLP